MKLNIIITLLMLCVAAVANAEIYTWTNSQGTVIFTDNPTQIPARYSGSTRNGDVVSIQTIDTQKFSKQPLARKPQAAKSRYRTTKPMAVVKPGPKPVPLAFQSEIKGHLGGDQIDPAPPSMKQPKPLPIGDQPKEMDPGMKQPKPLPMGDQPKAMPAGMKQPRSEPTGKQPPPTSSGMEQPDSKL